MENNIQLFTNQLFGSVRTILIDNDPYFCLVDICNILGLTNPTHIKESLDEKINLINSNPSLRNMYGGYKPYIYVSTPIQTGLRKDGTPAMQNRDLIYVNESGLYTAIFQSRKQEAVYFQLWVTTEVLPTMRKIGFNNALQVLQNRVAELETQNKYLYDQNCRAGELSLSKAKSDSENLYLTHYIVTNPYIPNDYKVQAFDYDPTLYNPDIDMNADIRNFKNNNGLY
jgi:prophage antirepressor-like protein